LCRFSRERGIWYNARGSAAGSIVAYTLEITLVDPIDHGLIFERFLNPGRVSMPDIDLDFRDDRRAEVLEYTARKYGDDKVAQIVTFGTLGARAAIRDVGRVMDIPLNEVDRVAKLVPNIPGKPVTIPEALEEIPDFKKLYDSEPYLRELIDTASKMEGVVRNAGTHAAGVIISDKPIIEYIPLHRPTGNASEDSPIKTVTQFEMTTLDSLGLLKVDFLGLATLSIMARACDLICERHGVNFNLNNIPTDDPGTYEMLGRGETAGVFQVEGSGMRRWLLQMKPKELANVIAMVALFRPGPMEFIPSYIRRMHGQEPVEYRHPALEPILKETYGITVYQEQIMYTAMKLAGYSASEADNLRKGVAKKKADVLLKHRQTFVKGAMENGIPEDIANQIFDDWEAFARYGFPKGHAADYGVIAVQTAYLKLHYPVEYMTALLSVSKNQTEKVALYVADSRRMNIEVRPPDVNNSGWDFTIEDCPDTEKPGECKPGIRFGLGAVKNVGHTPVAAILTARGDQPFKDLNDFARRVDLRQVGKRALESLVKVGALDSFGTRPSLLSALDRIVAVSASHFRAIESGQMSLFGAHTGITENIDLPLVNTEITRREILNWERELLGLYVSDHPLSPVMELLSQTVSHFSGQLGEAALDEKVRVAGLITRMRNYTTKTGKAMGFVTLEDVQGVVELVVFPRTWEQVEKEISVEDIVLVDGRVDNAQAEPKILVDRITKDLTVTTSAEPPPPRGNGFFVQDFEESPIEADWTPEPEVGAYSNEGVEQGLETEPAADEVAQSACRIPEGQGPLPGVEIAAVMQAPPHTASVLEKSHPPADRTTGRDEEAWQGSDNWGADGPPPPDAFLHNWEAEKLILKDPDKIELVQEEPVKALPEQAVKNVEVSIFPEEEAGINTLPPFILSPKSDEESGPTHMITVILRSTGDKTRDVLRLRRIHGIITSYPGRDRFAIHMFEKNSGYLVEFPNFTTQHCSELISRLRVLVGSENIRVEPILFQ
jgi:DNA polymerase III subunit alpha